jgi:hypothetical protein
MAAHANNHFTRFADAGNKSRAGFRAPMAIVVVGGLITSTFLSLLVIPVFFTNVDDTVSWVRSCRRARAAAAEHGLLG